MNEELNGVWDSDLEQELLAGIFILWYGAMLKAVHTLTLHILNLGPVPLDDPSIKRTILAAKAASVTVDEATKKLIAKRIADGASRGLNARQIAYGTDDFAGIDGLFDETWKSRPLTVARTELQRAQLGATVDRFRQLGKGVIQEVIAHDGDYDAYCSARDGRIYPISSAPDLAHPNCRLTLSPVIR